MDDYETQWFWEELEKEMFIKTLKNIVNTNEFPYNAVVTIGGIEYSSTK